MTWGVDGLVCILIFAVMKTPDSSQVMRSAGDAWTLGIQLGLILFGCTAGGWYLGRKSGHPVPWVIGGAALGFLLSLYETWKLCRRLGVTPPAGTGSRAGPAAPAEGRDAHE